MSISYELTLERATFADGSAGGGEARAGCWREGERESEKESEREQQGERWMRVTEVL